LQYPDKEWMFIAMKQITDRYGIPGVFSLHAGGGQLSLDVRSAKPGRRWDPDDELVFLSSK
jgi:hypothetical protein